MNYSRPQSEFHFNEMPVERCTHVLEYFRFIYLFKKHVHNGLLQTKKLPTKLKMNMNDYIQILFINTTWRNILYLIYISSLAFVEITEPSLKNNRVEQQTYKQTTHLQKLSNKNYWSSDLNFVLSNGCQSLE